MLQIIYASAATRTMSAADLRDILKTARARNAAVGVTGVLVYDDGSFLQVLEGPEMAVTALVERIKADPRHDHFRLLSRKDIQAREFGEWSMAFADAAEEAAGMDGFVDYDGSLPAQAREGALAMRVLRQFMEGAWHASQAARVVITRR